MSFIIFSDNKMATPCPQDNLLTAARTLNSSPFCYICTSDNECKVAGGNALSQFNNHNYISEHYNIDFNQLPDGSYIGNDDGAFCPQSAGSSSDQIYRFKVPASKASAITSFRKNNQQCMTDGCISWDEGYFANACVGNWPHTDDKLQQVKCCTGNIDLKGKNTNGFYNCGRGLCINGINCPNIMASYCIEFYGTDPAKTKYC